MCHVSEGKFFKLLKNLSKVEKVQKVHSSDIKLWSAVNYMVKGFNTN
jgi:hypothetical protein